MLAAGAPDMPDESRKPAGKLVTPDMPWQADMNILAAGAPVSPLVFRKPAGKLVSPVMPLHTR
jgi:hypothetical protein